jgi:tetratricopeptide (TPR) repeat protein
VRHTSSDDKLAKIVVWGPENRPAKEFLSDREFEKYADQEYLDQLRRRVEKNLASNRSPDLMERGQYYLRTQQWDAAIAALSQDLSSNPKNVNALVFRGMAYLFWKKHDNQVIADMTRCIEIEPEEEGVEICYYLRGLAYASEEATLSKAVSDMAKVNRVDADVQPCCIGAYLIPSAAHVRRGELGEALKCAEKAVKLNTDSADAHTVLAYTYEKRGNVEQAKAHRDDSKRLRAAKHDCNDLERQFDEALHHCLAKLLPEAVDDDRPK